MSELQAPEDVFANASEPPLELRFKCNACGRRFSDTFAWACVDPAAAVDAEDWDGVLLSHEVECPKCGATDDYTASKSSLVTLSLKAIVATQNERLDGRVVFGSSQLWDGTPVRRPSQALAHLRRLTEERPDTARAFRALGNACNRFGRPVEAVAAWQKACEIDPHEVEAAYALARFWWDEGDHAVEGFGYLRLAVQRLPEALKENEDVRRMGPLLGDLLEEVVAQTSEPMALMAAWSTGEIQGALGLNISSVDLRKVKDFGRLAEFVMRQDVVGLEIIPELPEDEPTILHRLLEGRLRASHGLRTIGPLERAETARRSASSVPGRGPGRNSPCPCGSRRKYKHCCGR